MLRSQDGASHREEMPIGVFSKKLLDRKYRNVVQLKPLLTESLVFSEGLKNDQRAASAVTHPAQLHYEILNDGKGGCELDLDAANIQTLAQLIDANPAVVAQPGFIDDTIRTLFDFTILLHERGIYHLCYAPQEIFVRKSDQLPMLLLHASHFVTMTVLAQVYTGFERFVAPEVLSDHVAGERQDVYALGRLIEWLFQHSDLPFEYKKVVSRATQTDPEQRYASVADMKQALQARRNMKRSAFTFGAAVAAVLLCVWLYFELVPQSADIEFVNVANKADAAAELPDSGFNPETELGLWEDVDSIDVNDTLTASERAQMDAYMKKAEEIFRRQYQREADRIISKVYTKEGMSLSENVFVASTNAMTDELKEMERKLAEDAGISDEKAVRIAAEINDQLAREKQRNLNTKAGTHGVTRPQRSQSEE